MTPGGILPYIAFALMALVVLRMLARHGWIG